MESRLNSRCPTIAAHNYRYAKDVCPLEGTQYSAYLRHTTSTPVSSRRANTNRNPNLSNLINSSRIRSLYLFSKFHETFKLFCSQMAVTTLLLPAFGGSKKGAHGTAASPSVVAMLMPYMKLDAWCLNNYDIWPSVSSRGVREWLSCSHSLPTPI